MNNERLGTLFSTSENSHYFYDSGNGKIISCNLKEKEFITKILNNEISVEKACSLNPEFATFISSENLFACPEYRDFMIPEKEEFPKVLKGTCEQAILELTESCNLRCGYCIYNDHHPDFRGFSNKKMSFEVAKKSIDYLLTDYKKERFALTFYGGEPLTNFDLMKKCIEYTKEQYPNINLDISFTTNLTLLTEEMVDYFKCLDNIYILCSIDGPEIIHDKYRRYVNGKGTFNDVIKGLRLLLDKFYEKGNENRIISINSVVTPPYSRKNLDEINDFFYKELKLPKDIWVNYSYLNKGDMVFDFNNNSIISDDIEKKLEVSPIEEWAVDNLIDDKQNEDYFSVVSNDMLRIAKRIKSDNGLIELTYLHGNCIPGQRRVYVTVAGDFRTCERIGDAPSIGDYEKGYYFDKIYKTYYEDYIKYFREICKDCWAQPMCSVCYERLMDKDGIKPSVENSLCPTSRRLIKDSFVNYYRLMETDRESLQEIISKYEKIQEEAEGIRKYEV
ncbi:radical SAM protein [Clostridium botulinum]|uniref:radical SAM protein n=1 Tax=Clostridium botulinum TaxID=1491 RepID=UPI0009B2C706|nr:radical SAM protein [Clostridium botulinum]